MEHNETNVSLYQIDTTQKTLKYYIDTVTSVNNDIQKRISDSLTILGWYSNEVSRKDVEITKAIASLKVAQQRFRAELKSLKFQKSCLRSPRWTTETYTDSNGNKKTQLVHEDPDADKRAELEARISETERKLQIVEDQIPVAQAYKDNCEQAKKDIARGNEILLDIKKRITSDANDAIATFHTLQKYTAELRKWVEEYISCRQKYAFPSNLQTISAPHKPFKKTAFYKIASSVFSSISDSVSSMSEQESTVVNIPSKLKKISDTPLTFQVIGVYEEKTELAKDMAILIENYDYFLVKVHKNIGNHFVFCQTPKELYDFMLELCLDLKRTVRGTRYEDINGFIYFIYSKKAQ